MASTSAITLIISHLGTLARSFAHADVSVTYGFAVSDATVSAKAISSVCLSSKAQPSLWEETEGKMSCGKMT